MDELPGIRTIAVGLELGILKPQDAIAWADRHIMRLDEPPYWLIEFSLASRASAAELLKILLEHGRITAITDREFLGGMALLMIDHREGLTGILPLLFDRFCLSEATSLPEVRDEIHLIDDELDWDRPGAGIRARRMLEEFLQEGRELVSSDPLVGPETASEPQMTG